MMSLQECRAALLAVKETTDKPVIVTLTFQDDGRTLFGTEPGTAITVLQAMGADAVGVNCGAGPDSLKDVVKRMSEFAKVPIVMKPNAGLPVLNDGVTTYDLDPEGFISQMRPVIESGAVDIAGGCCGTDERYIRALRELISDVKKAGSDSLPGETESVFSDGTTRILTNERNLLKIGQGGSFIIVGERINPTGKKGLQAELREGSTDMVLDFAAEQIECGAKVLDVNMGMNGIDEKEMMCRVIDELTMSVDVPLCIDSSDPDVIEAALRIYPGRALINSVSLEPGKPERIFPLAKKYGAMVILLPLTREGLPKDLNEKHAALDELISIAHSYGLSDEDLVADGLVATIGANKNAARDVMETIKYCQEKNLATICGLSNISFGLPERMVINTAFLTMAIAEGLTMAISNPCQTMLRNAAYAADLLMAKEGSDADYINGVRPLGLADAGNVSTDKTAKKQTAIPEDMLNGQESELFMAVLNGRKKALSSLIDEQLKANRSAKELIDKELIPAINLVGALYEKKIFFLPQLISSAETMEQAVAYIEPHLEINNDAEDMATVIMATVEGDVHDIGKNLVVLMLKNYGYNVIDMGKDVPGEDIIAMAAKTDADIIGLSALMTTMMTKMAEVVKLRDEAGIRAKIIIGGACVTREYADEIGADGYSEDAMEAVEEVNRLIGKC
ncbi:MAG: dihydropteroate synthase, partial [Eubacterium sp.]|nr:dihydropteroate synthase [Eubacterium sp.]